MAYALVKSATGNSGSATTTLSVSLASAPTSGNLLVFAMAGDKNTGALTLAGFTQVYSMLSASVSLYLWYKVSNGTETTINPTWATSSPAGNTAWYGEISGGGPSWTVTAQASNITNEATVLTWSTGTTGNIGAAGFGVAVAAVDSSQSVTTVSAWGNSYATVYSATALSGRGAVFVADKDEPTTGVTTSSALTYTGTADQVSAAIAVFATTSAAPSATGRALVAVRADATAVPVRNATAHASVAVAGRSAATKTAVVTTRAGAAIAGWATTTKTATATGRAGAGLAARTTATKTATATGSTSIGTSASATVAPAGSTARGWVGANARAGAVRIATASARVAVGVHARTTAVRVATATTARALVAVASHADISAPFVPIAIGLDGSATARTFDGSTGQPATLGSSATAATIDGSTGQPATLGGTTPHPAGIENAATQPGALDGSTTTTGGIG